MKKIFIIPLALAVLFSACNPPKEEVKTDMPPGLDMAMMNKEVSPKEDFYQFANGGWLETTEIPEDEGRWGGFGELRDKNDKIMLDIMYDLPDLEDVTSISINGQVVRGKAQPRLRHTPIKKKSAA